MMNSNDLFDFNGYLDQFKGQQGSQFDFMQKLVYTQSFSNFIEETYRLSTKIGITEKPKEIIDLTSAEA